MFSVVTPILPVVPCFFAIIYVSCFYFMSIHIITLKNNRPKSPDSVATRSLVNGWEGFTGPNFYGLAI